MPRSPNPHRMGTPQVFEYAITTTPTGAYQPIGLVIAGNVFLSATLQITTPEVTGASKSLDIQDPDGYWDPTRLFVDTPIVVSAPIIASSGPTPAGQQLCYKAVSNDWAEFRGLLKILYIPFGTL